MTGYQNKKAAAPKPVAWMTINEYGEDDDIHYENPEGHLLEGWTFKPLYTTPQFVLRQYRRGDRLLCLETEEYCVIHISGTDRQWVKFPDSNVGVYTNEQVAELFELLPKEQEINSEGDIRALKHRIHELEGELIGYKKIVAEQESIMTAQAMRIVDLKTHIENLEGEE